MQMEKEYSYSSKIYRYVIILAGSYADWLTRWFLVYISEPTKFSVQKLTLFHW